MVQTITPAGCGSRHRYRLALAAFTAAAVLASSVLGAILGLLGSRLPYGVTLPVLAALALVGASRELGLLPVAVPQLRRQVPERWRRELPLGTWSAGYGAGLGVGMLSHQPSFLFWAVCAGALAQGDPGLSAATLALFGIGRSLMVALPTRGGRDPVLAVATLARGASALRRLGAAMLAAVAVIAILAFAEDARAIDPPRGSYDPTVSGRVLAVARVVEGSPDVAVLEGGRPPRVFLGGRSPSLDGPRLAYADDLGIRVVVWRHDREAARVAGNLSKPALEWPWLAFVRTGPRVLTLELLNLRTGARRIVDRALPSEDIGRPALRGGVLAWHANRGRHSEIRLSRIARPGLVRILAVSRYSVLANPSITASNVLWVESDGERSTLELRRLYGGPQRTLHRVTGPHRILWTTALGQRRAYVTEWSLTTRSALIVRLAFHR